MSNMIGTAAFAHLKLHVFSSSHLSPLDPVATRQKFARMGTYRADREMEYSDQLLKSWLPEGTYINAWGGLTIAETEFHRDPHDFSAKHKKSELRAKQCIQLGLAIKSSPCKIALHVSGSNDFKYFIVKDGKLVPLTESGAETWSKLSPRRRSNFLPNKTVIFGKTSREFIHQQVKLYVTELVNLYRDSEFELVFHSSVLERKYFHEKLENIDAYFAYFNYWIRMEIENLNREKIMNRNQIAIVWKFINVSSQFFNSNSPRKLYRWKEAKTGNCVHRNLNSLHELVDKYLKYIGTTVQERAM